MTIEKIELGIQPLEALMVRLKITNHDLVKASTEQLTFKMVRKGRMGRRLTRNVQNKILHAVRIASPSNTFILKDLFNY